MTNNLSLLSDTPFLDDNLYVNRFVDSAWQGYYFMHDGLGSVANIISSSNVLKKTYQYFAFGEIKSETGNDLPNRYKFTGRELDNESGNYYYRARTYSPATGRFVSRDPIGYDAGINLYSYAQNNPIIYTDPEGLNDFDYSSFLEHGNEPELYRLVMAPKNENRFFTAVIHPVCNPAYITESAWDVWKTSYCTTNREEGNRMVCPEYYVCPAIREGGCDYNDITASFPCKETESITVSCLKTTGKKKSFSLGGPDRFTCCELTKETIEVEIGIKNCEQCIPFWVPLEVEPIFEPIPL